MNKAYALAVLTAVLSGCSLTAAAGKRQIEWPGEASTQLIVPLTEAGAALAAVAAIREMVRTNPYPDLFWGCSSPEQGLDVVVFKDLSSSLYYVSLIQRFDRCGNPRGSPSRVLDGYYEYAVTAQGEVVAEVLLPDEAPVLPPPPGPTPAEQTSSPAAQPPDMAADTSAPIPAPAPQPAPPSFASSYALPSIATTCPPGARYADASANQSGRSLNACVTTPSARSRSFTSGISSARPCFSPSLATSAFRQLNCFPPGPTRVTLGSGHTLCNDNPGQPASAPT